MLFYLPGDPYTEQTVNIESIHIIRNLLMAISVW